MPQVAKRSASSFILNSLDEMEESQVIRVENHKNDRFLEIMCIEGFVEIREDGYRKEVHKVERPEVKSLIGKLIDFEFPRSHKLRIKKREYPDTGDLKISPWSERKLR